MDLELRAGPRINKTGRLSDMTLGIGACCRTTRPGARAGRQAGPHQPRRRDLEAGMREQAEAMIEHVLPQGDAGRDRAVRSPVP